MFIKAFKIKRYEHNVLSQLDYKFIELTDAAYLFYYSEFTVS